MNQITSRMLRKISSLLLLTVFALSLIIPAAQAANVPADLGRLNLSITMEGEAFRLQPRILDDLFDLDGIACPGGSWKKTVRVKNLASEPADVCIISCTTEDMDTTLFDALHTTVVVKGEEAYNGSYGAGSDSSPMAKGFTVNSGSSLDFEITVSLPSTCGNEIQGKEMNSVFQFGVSAPQPQTPGQNPGQNPGEIGGGGGSIVIDDDDDVRYTVFYKDTNGNELHEKKMGWAEVGEKVTEKAVIIEGYTPDAPEKSIILKGNVKDNEISFVYTSTELPEQPEVPSTPKDPVDPAVPEVPTTPEPPEKPSGIKTGVELGDQKDPTVSSTLAFVMLVSIVCAGIIVYMMIPTLSDKNKPFRKEKTRNDKE